MNPTSRTAGAVANTDGGHALRVAIVGTGMISESHRRGALLAGARLSGVLGSSPERSREVADRWNLEHAYPSLDALLESDVDIVHIATPNDTHAPYSIAALRAGKHVVCEKPLGLDLAEAQSMAVAAQESGLVATVPFVYRYHPLVREIRARREAGEFGDLNLVHGSYLQDWMLPRDAASWRVSAGRGGRSRAFGDIGSHWVDLVEWVTGHRFATLVAATSIAYPTRPGGSVPAFSTAAAATEEVEVTTEDGAVALLRTAAGLLASATISQVAAGRKNRLWFEIDGSRGSAAFDQENPETIWLGTDEGSRTLARSPEWGSAEQRRLSVLPAGHAQGYALAFDAFVADTYSAVRGGDPIGLPTFADGVRSAQVVDALLRSRDTGAWTEI